MNHAETLGAIFEITGELTQEKRCQINNLLCQYEHDLQDSVIRTINSETYAGIKLGFDIGVGR